MAVETAGEGPAVFLVHGLGFSARHWQGHVAALVEAGFQAVTVDLRGFGASAMPSAPYDVETLSGDLERVREALGIEQLHLVGHSLGGMVAQQYALRRPERLCSLVLASTSNHNGRRASLLARVMARLCAEGFDVAMADPEVEAQVEALCESLAVLLPAIKGPMRRVAERPSPGRALAWQAIDGFSVRGRLDSLKLPAFVVHGEKDLLIPCIAGALVAQGIPGARWQQVAGAGHNLPLEREELFRDQLLDFLNEVEKR